MPQTKPTTCAFRGCEKPSDPEIFFIMADQRVLRFCSDAHLLKWDSEMMRTKARSGLGERTDKVDARAY